jgi:tetratricopeptide (TPR) repeat protein
LLLVTIIWLLSLQGCSLSPEKVPGEPMVDSEKQTIHITDDNGNPYANTEQDAIRQQFAQSLALIQSGQHEQAEKVLYSLQNKYPHLSGIYVNLAMIYWHKEAPEKAEAFNKQALELNRNNADAWVFEGIMQRNRGNFLAAETAYRTAIAVNPNHQNAWLNLAFLKDLYLAEYTEALKCYTHYAQLNPEDKRTENWMIDLKRRMESS